MSSFAKKSWNWLKWPLAMAILAVLYHQNRAGIAQVAGSPKHWGFLVAAFILCLGSCLLTFVRWYLLVWAQGFHFRLRDAVRLGFLGMILSYVGPGALGGDIFKAIFLAREQTSRRAVAVATVILDRILGMLALFMVGAVATLFYRHLNQTPELQLVTALLWLGTLGGLAGLALMLHPAPATWGWVNRLIHLPYVGHAIGDLLHGVALYQTHRGAVANAVIISVFGHSGLICGFYCGALALQPWAPDLGMHFYFMPIAELFSVLIPLPGGVGALEGAVQHFYEMFAANAVTAEVASAAGFISTIAYRVVQIAIVAAGTAYLFSSRQELRAGLDEAQRLDNVGGKANRPQPPAACEVSVCS